ncbi:membrane protein [Altererythrobacter sp. B11]|uniref:ABC transporter permease n=1 Tax=Altererythrobacter sp. B11 TaxID=2060312 RepID=UPI000DC6ED1B|nr:ABC transporter permease [Altererythrobacter sp. B11]BBC72187.1 membrane protein [Altererythrobacter sp. B11]
MRRLQAMIVKEIWSLLRDPKARIVLVFPPLMQLFVFTFATTLDVSNVQVAVFDQSQGAHAAELVQRIEGSPNFRQVAYLHSTAEVERAIDRQAVIAALVIEPDFDARLDRGEPAQVGLVLDGRRSNAAQIVNGYIAQIAGQMNREAVAQLSGGGVEVTNWFNPALDFKWFTLPGLIVIITSIAGIAITSQTVSRERELGTFDQLLVSPLRAHEILAGKVVPPVLVGMFNGTLFLILAQLVFGVPYTGSLLLFFPSLVLYMFSLVGIGLFVSSLSMTQQQSFLGAFAVTVPLMLLSGYASPIENMPHWLQPITYLDPARYFLTVVQGLFLKDLPAGAVFRQLWPLALIAVATLTAAGRLFRARME